MVKRAVGGCKNPALKGKTGIAKVTQTRLKYGKIAAQ
jgi:hypothetical protein